MTTKDVGTELRCPKCGSDKLTLTHYYDLSSTAYATLPCDCGESEVAAEERTENVESWMEWAWLDEDGAWDDYEDREKLNDEEADSDIEVECQKCYDKAIEDNVSWESDPHRTESHPEQENQMDGPEYEVACGDCKHKIGPDGFDIDWGNKRVALR